MPQHKPPADAAYRTDYEKGWRYAARPTATLEGRYAESNAWYDGYADYVSGHDKWHHFYCRQSGGCPVHTY